MRGIPRLNGTHPRVTLGTVDARTQSALLAAIVTLALALAMLLRKGRTYHLVEAGN